MHYAEEDEYRSGHDGEEACGASRLPLAPRQGGQLEQSDGEPVDPEREEMREEQRRDKQRVREQTPRPGIVAQLDPGRDGPESDADRELEIQQTHIERRI